jgi:hypothetical protein
MKRPVLVLAFALPVVGASPKDAKAPENRFTLTVSGRRSGIESSAANTVKPACKSAMASFFIGNVDLDAVRSTIEQEPMCRPQRAA